MSVADDNKKYHCFLQNLEKLNNHQNNKQIGGGLFEDLLKSLVNVCQLAVQTNKTEQQRRPVKIPPIFEIKGYSCEVRQKPTNIVDTIPNLTSLPNDILQNIFSRVTDPITTSALKYTTRLFTDVVKPHNTQTTQYNYKQLFTTLLENLDDNSKMVLTYKLDANWKMALIFEKAENIPIVSLQMQYYVNNKRHFYPSSFPDQLGIYYDKLRQAGFTTFTRDNLKPYRHNVPENYEMIAIISSSIISLPLTPQYTLADVLTNLSTFINTHIQSQAPAPAPAQAPAHAPAQAPAQAVQPRPAPLRQVFARLPRGRPERSQCQFRDLGTGKGRYLRAGRQDVLARLGL